MSNIDQSLGSVDLPISELKDLPRHILIERAQARAALNLRESKEECEKSLAAFIRQAWHIVEPAQPYVHNWHISFIAHHLQAITDGEINRLLINVPPGMMKSLLVNVFWPAWEWTKKPGTRYICTAHSQNLAIRDSTKMRRLVASKWYLDRWGETVKLTGDQNAKTKFENTATGFREAVAFESMTGVRGDRVTIDDPHSVDSAMSDVQRQSAIETFLEAVPTRLVNPKSSAIVVIMQRLHTDDVSGIILEKNLGYTHIMLPMEYDPERACHTDLGFEDPRQREGELLFPARFPAEVVERDKQVMGPWAVAGQFQQSPTPRGGGIIKRSYWQLWDDAEAQAQGMRDASQYPPMDYIVASLDPAYTEKKENDPSALTIWGVWQKGGSTARRLLSRDSEVATILDDRDTIPCAMLMFAWEKRLPIHGQDVFREQGETDIQFKLRQQENYGLVEHVIATCNKYKVDMLLVESKASGLSVAQEIKRLNRTANWGVYLVNPGNMDKVGRMYAVQPIFANGVIYAPDRDWADKVITQAETFPKARHDDLCLVGDTLISMADGSRQRLDAIRIGDLVETPEGPKRVLAANQTGVEPIWRLEYTGGYLEGTAGHPVFANGGWVELVKLSPHDNLVSSYPCEGELRARRLNQNTCWVKAVTFTDTTRPVFNLTVEDAHCYYANGVLTHNCDSTSQALKYLREKGFLRRAEEVAMDIRSGYQLKAKSTPVYDV